MRRWLVLGALVLGTGGWLLGWSPYLRVEAIAVSGIKAGSPLTRAQVLQQARLQVGVPMARVSEASVRRSLLRIARIDSVDLVRVWPRSLEVRIVERTPWAVARTPAGRYYVDAEGAFFATSGPAGAVLPEVRLPRREPRLVRDLVTVVSALPEDLVVASMSATSSTDLAVDVLAEQGSLRIIWGDVSETPLKARVLRSLLEKAKATRWSQIDLSAPRAPTTRE